MNITPIIMKQFVRTKGVIAVEGRECTGCGKFKEWKEFAVDHSSGNSHTRKCKEWNWHHTDSSNKEISVSCLMQSMFERLWVEVQKCKLMCANCHSLEHISVELRNKQCYA